MVSVFGTMAADVLHVGLGIPYAVSPVFFVVSLTGVFGLWFVSERPLSIHSIDTRSREVLLLGSIWRVVCGLDGGFRRSWRARLGHRA